MITPTTVGQPFALLVTQNNGEFVPKTFSPSFFSFHQGSDINLELPLADGYQGVWFKYLLGDFNPVSEKVDDHRYRHTLTMRDDLPSLMNLHLLRSQAYFRTYQSCFIKQMSVLCEKNVSLVFDVGCKVEPKDATDMPHYPSLPETDRLNTYQVELALDGIGVPFNELGIHIEHHNAPMAQLTFNVLEPDFVSTIGEVDVEAEVTIRAKSGSERDFSVTFKLPTAIVSFGNVQDPFVFEQTGYVLSKALEISFVTHEKDF